MNGGLSDCRALQASLRARVYKTFWAQVTSCDSEQHLDLSVPREMWSWWVGSGNETGNEHLAHRPVAAVKTGSGAEELSAADVAL